MSLSSLPFRSWVLLLVIWTGSVAGPTAAAEPGKLVPADADAVLTVNLRRFLNEHKETDCVRRALELYRLALKGDAKGLQGFYGRERWLKEQGITEQQFLDGARGFRSACDVLGIDVLQDVDQVLCGFRTDPPGAWGVLLQGRFKQDRIRAAMKQLADLLPGAIRSDRVGDRELWQISVTEAEINLVVIDAETVAVGTKDWIGRVLPQAAGKKTGLTAGTRALLDETGKEHIALLTTRAARVIDRGLTFLEDANAGPKDEIVSLAVAALKIWARRNGDDLGAASVGLSLGTGELRVQLGVEARKLAARRRLARLVNQVLLGGSVALLASKEEAARDLAAVLGGTRLSVNDAAVVVRIPVKYAFLTKVAAAPSGPAYTFKEALARSIANIPVWGPPRTDPAVEEVRDIAYRTDEKADPYRHTLDVFRPKGKKDCPVAVLVHGGAWVHGSKRLCGLYSSVGHFLASQGIIAVLPNYRLSPHVRHPAHAQDVAAAMRWTKANIARYGGNPDRLFAVGHSAGAHLVSLLATDETYLAAEGLKTADIKGVIAVSGVYRVPATTPQFTLGGSGPLAVRLDQLLPLRGPSEAGLEAPVGFPAPADIFEIAFGADEKTRANASPLTHVRPGLPPFLILIAERELPTLPAMADEFHHALLGKDCAARLIKVAKRNHTSILFSAIRMEDPVGRAIVEFVTKSEGNGSAR